MGQATDPLTTRIRHGVRDQRRKVVAAGRFVRRRSLHNMQLHRAVRARGLFVVHAIGDSHARVFHSMRRQRLLAHTVLDVESVSGATAFGLTNDRSQTNARARFERCIALARPDDAVVALLGEVDVGFLCWRRAAERGTDVHDEAKVSFDRYTGFLATVQASCPRLVVCATPPPTIADYTNWNGLGKERKQLREPLGPRLDLTRTYNAWLATWCDEHAVPFVDYVDEVLDADGVVADRYRDEDANEHHLATTPYAALLARHLEPLIERWRLSDLPARGHGQRGEPGASARAQSSS